MILPAIYSWRLPLGRYSKQSNNWCTSAMTKFPSYFSIIRCLSEQYPRKRTTCLWFAIIRLLTSRSNSCSYLYARDIFFTATVLFSSFPCGEKMHCQRQLQFWDDLSSRQGNLELLYLINNREPTAANSLLIRETICDFFQKRQRQGLRLCQFIT